MVEIMQIASFHHEGEIVVTEDQGYTQGYLDFPFEVPPGVDRLRLRLQYSPLNVGNISNLITLGLFDPRGFRGNAHRHPPDPEITVSEREATPGFLPGEIPVGNWLAQLAIQSVVADRRPCRYALDIELLSGGDPEAPGLDEPVRAVLDEPARAVLNEPAKSVLDEPAKSALDEPARAVLDDPPDPVLDELAESVLNRLIPPSEQASANQPGWFRGELHSHTIHSDGDLTPHGLVALAYEKQLDFLAITDHNTVSALREIDPAHLAGLLLIPGMELTTFCGHALVLGTDRWIDWRTGYHGRKMEEAAQEAREAGGLFIMAHPNDFGSPICTGCRWEYTDFDLNLADGIEIWNGPWNSPSDGNPTTLEIWQLLQTGSRHLPATCGCDVHRPDDWEAGRPSIYVFASELSIPAVLEGVRQGRVVISAGPWLTLQVSTPDGSSRAGIGDTLRSIDGQVSLEIGWDNAPQGAQLIIRNSTGRIATHLVTSAGDMQQNWTARSGDRVWVELYTKDDALVAITNPVFIQY